jgi:hypothetical protein
MPWTAEQKVDSLMRLPWTLVAEQADDAGEYMIRVKELPGLLVIGTKQEINDEFWDALRATLESYLEFEDRYELPPGVKCVPWEAAPPKNFVHRVIARRKDADEDSPASATAFTQNVVVAYR